MMPTNIEHELIELVQRQINSGGRLIVLPGRLVNEASSEVLV